MTILNNCGRTSQTYLIVYSKDETTRDDSSAARYTPNENTESTESFP